MIDDRELTKLLEAAADDYVVPADGPERILKQVAGTDTPAAPRWRTHRLAVACAAVIVVVVGTMAIRQLTPGGSEPKTAVQPARLPTGAGEAADTGTAGSTAAGSTGGPAGGAPVLQGERVDQASPLRGTETPAHASPAPTTPDTAKVVKTGSVQLEVSRKAVGPTMSRLTSLATGLGGYVADARTAEGADDPTGSVTLRVPAATFDDLLTQVRGLGEVRSSTTHGQDVTGQYSDIQARLTALNATRDQLLTILQKATAIGDVLAVQDRINGVQTQIEQLQGQQKMLDDQTSFASLSVDVAQPGATHGPPDKPSGLSKAWEDARHGFTSGVEDILAASGTALVILLALAALVVLGRFVWLAARRRTL